MINFGQLKKYSRSISVLFIEDDNDFRKEFYELLLDIFPIVDTEKNGELGLAQYMNYYNKNKKTYDLVISDIKMPQMDGVELIKEIYGVNKEQVVIVLSARNEFKYLHPLINLGIEHFFAKPLNYKTFLNEILQVCYKIYQYNLPNNSEFIFIDVDTVWNKQKKELLFKGKIVELTKKEILLISKLLETSGRLYTIEELVNTLWFDEPDINADATNLKNVVSRLRKKIPSIKINNIYSMGYKIEINSIIKEIEV